MKRRESKAIAACLLQLTALARRERPWEACGLIGWDGAQMHLLPCTNVAEEPRHSFLIGPGEQAQVLAGIEREGWELWGIYHSHPDQGAEPSKHDIAFAREINEQWPYGLHWVIVGLEPDDDSEAEIWVGNPT